MARRARAARQRSAAARGVPASPYIRRRLPVFDVLDEEALRRIEDQVDWIVQDVGVAFRGDPEAQRIWREAGARIDDEDRVRAPADWIRDLCSRAPRQFTQLARNPDRSVVIGGDNQVYAAVYGPPFVRDLEGGRRYGDLESFRNLVKLIYMHPHLHHGSFVVCEPCDIPVSTRHLDMLHAHMTLSDKPHFGAITEMSRAQDSVDMAEIVFGGAATGEQCFILGNVNTNSPLLVDKVVTEAIRAYCGRGQGIAVAPFILSGAMGPVSTAASVAQALAEALAVCAFAQLVRPGSPFILGNFLTSMSLKSGAPTFGTPEPALSHYVMGQLARRAGLPARFGGSLTASKIEDAQAAYESADSMHSTVMAGANFVLQAAGWLEGGLCTGFEKLVMDADRLGSYRKLVGEGFDSGDEALARDAYGEVGPGGHFLGCDHTMRNYLTAFYEPALSDSATMEHWLEGGSTDMRRRAHERWKEMLEQYRPPPMDEAVREELDAFVARRKEELPEAWY